MAIARGAGTEIIRSAHFEEVDSTVSKLIVGEQHHIYTILSLIVHCRSVASSGNQFILEILGMNAKTLTSAHTIEVSRWTGVANETFVWNDKFSMQGFEGAVTTSALNTAAEQNQISDQNSSIIQYLQCRTTAATDNFDVHITFIDQNNA